MPVVLPFIPALHSLCTATYYSENYTHLIAASLASRFGNELYGWSIAFLRKLATCAHSGYELCGWLVAFLRQIELAMSYMAD